MRWKRLLVVSLILTEERETSYANWQDRTWLTQALDTLLLALYSTKIEPSSVHKYTKVLRKNTINHLLRDYMNPENDREVSRNILSNP